MFFSKFLKIFDISYNIENFKAKILNVHDDKHSRIMMSTSRGRAERQINMSKLFANFFGDMVFPARKGVFEIGKVFLVINNDV